MHQKWKYIIANWINCYFYEHNNKNETQVNHESLLNIIFHLRENLNLHESKLSIFGAHSLEEFISEKYPNFKFGNGTVEVTNEDDTYIAASLLLFFVCVNSKDVVIKNVMCSKLSPGDQEIILKFSKSLMECHSISSHDVIAAITEACGSEVANGEASRLGPAVAETPPALRSLHGEVRRLQAALDAERFDRNYLQDELARTNIKMEKLARDKEQYKADIIDLKAKISMCCGQEAEARGDEGKSSEIAKLSRQLQQMEHRVVDVQEQLEEVQHERDTYKTKLEELKGECDRLLVLSREEATRAGQLAEELESEKRQSQTLRELVIELRQHNHRNGFDSSLLECDDPDTSVQSFQRSFSVCSEVCANVVEVQLGEEREKCLALKQQIQSLQDNMNEQVEKADILQKIITDRENDIFNLKHHINEEIEEKNNLKSYFDNEVTKLNNIVNELEQKLKDNSKHSNLVIEKKMQDIQILQEEKLSLLQSLSDETTKSDNIIKDLKADLDKEKTLKMKMRDDYENLVMKMKEKVLNRNNELVELQNNVSKNSELIEQLNLEIRKERESKNEIINKYNKDKEFWIAQKNNLEKGLQSKCAEISELVKQNHQRDVCIDEMTKMKETLLIKNNELIELQNNILQKNELFERQDLELRKEIELKDKIIQKYNKEIEILIAQKSNVEEDLQSKSAEITELIKQIHQRDACIDEMKVKGLNESKELVELQNNILQKSEIIEQLNLKLVKERELKDETINQSSTEIELLKAQKNKVEEVLQARCNETERELAKQIQQRDACIDELTKMRENLSIKNNELIELQNNILQKNELFERQDLELRKEIELKDKTIQKYNKEIEILIAQKSNVEEDLQSKCAEITELIKQIHQRDACIDEMKVKGLNESKELVELQNNILQKSEIIEQLNLKLVKERELKDETINQSSTEIELLKAQKNKVEEVLQARCNETERELAKQIHQRDACIDELTKMRENLSIKNNELIELQNNILQKDELIERQDLEIRKEIELKDKIIHKYNKDIELMIAQKSNVEEDLQSKCAEITELIKQIHQRDACIDEMKVKSLNESKELFELQNNILQKSEIIEQLNLKLVKERELKDETINQSSTEIELLKAQKNKVEEVLQARCNETERELAKQIQQRDACIDELTKMRENLSIKNNELIELQNNILQKDELIERQDLEIRKEIELKDKTIHKYNKDIELLIAQKSNVEEDLQSKCAEISELIKQIHQRDACIDERMKDLEYFKTTTSQNNLELTENLKQKLEMISMLEEKISHCNKNIVSLEADKVSYQTLIAELEKEREDLRDSNKTLKSENDKLTTQKKEFELQMEILHKDIQELNNKLITLKEENSELLSVTEQNQSDMTKLEQKIKQEENERTAMSQTFEQEKIKYESEYNVLLEKYSTTLEELENQNKELFKCQMKMKQEENERTAMSQTFEQEKIKYESEYNDLLEKYSTTLEELENQNKELSKCQMKIKKEENERTAMSQTFEQEKIKYESEYNVLLEKYSTTLEELENQNKELFKFQDIINNNNNVINDLKKDSGESKKLLAQLYKEKEILENEKHSLIEEKNRNLMKISKLEEEMRTITFEELPTLKETNIQLTNIIEGNKAAIAALEKVIKKELEQNESLRKENSAEKLELIRKYNTLQENLHVVEQKLSRRNQEINALQEEILKITSEAASREEELKGQNKKLTDIIEEKEALICKINKTLCDEISLKGQYKKDAELKENNIRELQNILKDEKHAIVETFTNENRMFTEQIAQIESNAVQGKFPGQWNDDRDDKKQDDLHPQVDCISSINISNSDSNKIIRDLEIILNDKNRTITSLQIDITFLKSFMAESENKVLDLTKDLETSQENCQQLSNQLKKILHQKNEEISELKNKISKVSAMENRASQIIKVSAKYQEIIHKRMAEIKSNTVLKELTNFSNAVNGESDLKRSLNSGTITMKDLESFLETTDRHIRRCSEKRFALQKERDRLLEVNRINESEIISVKKFLTELSVTVKTFNSVKEIYTQKLSRVVSLQRTVRREILNVEGRLTDAAVCKLERGYAATMQDLAECVMNLERWVERSIGRAISAEKIKQAFTSDSERNSLAPATFQNASLEAQMDQLENSFQKLLEEAVRAQKGDGAKDSLAMTVQEVRAEYEEKLSRMKTKMKELYQKEVQSFKEAQREEVTTLHHELQSTKEKLRQSRKEYEEEIRSLTLELWNVGEKFLDKADEANRLKRKQHSGSLMSLQHVPSSRFGAQTEEPGRSSDTHSLKSLPVNINKKREGRGLHMSDEEGEVFDNACLRELNTPRTPRLSELRWRNSLCPPHLKSSYPAETQFSTALHEDDIKAGPAVAEGRQRKEVGITAYKKPGPPTPSKQAGRLSATDSELRELMRVEAEPQPRKTTTPSRLRSLFSSARNDNVEGTPRSRRLSNFFSRKK